MFPSLSKRLQAKIGFEWKPKKASQDSENEEPSLSKNEQTAKLLTDIFA